MQALSNYPCCYSTAFLLVSGHHSEAHTVIAVWVVVVVLFGHWVADFVLQPHWMSLRKSTDWWVLLQHAYVITLGGVVVGLVVVMVADHTRPPGYLGIWAVLNGAAHFAIDAVTSRITSKLWRKGETHNFFVVIGFDQFLHVAFAVATLSWLVMA